MVCSIYELAESYCQKRSQNVAGYKHYPLKQSRVLSYEVEYSPVALSTSKVRLIMHLELLVRPIWRSILKRISNDFDYKRILRRLTFLRLQGNLDPEIRPFFWNYCRKRSASQHLHPQIPAHI